jgi:hypothetical protein
MVRSIVLSPTFLFATLTPPLELLEALCCLKIRQCRHHADSMHLVSSVGVWISFLLFLGVCARAMLLSTFEI